MPHALPLAPAPPAQGLLAWAGPAGTGKTGAVIQRVKVALGAGLPAGRLCVFLNRPQELARWQEALAPLPVLCGQAHLGGFSAWWRQELQAHWPLLAEAGAPPLPPEGVGSVVGPQRLRLAVEALGPLGAAGLWADSRWVALAEAVQALDGWAGAWGQSPEAGVGALGHLFAQWPEGVLLRALKAWRAWAWAQGHLVGGVGLAAYAERVWPHPMHQEALKHRAGLVVVDGASALPPIAWSLLAAWAQAGAKLLLVQDEPAPPEGWMAAGPRWARAWWAQAQPGPGAVSPTARWCQAAAERVLGLDAEPVVAEGVVHALDGGGGLPAWLRRAQALVAEGMPPEDLAIVLPKWRPSLGAQLEASGLPWARLGPGEACLAKPALRRLWLLWLGRWVPQHPSLRSALGDRLQEDFGPACAEAWEDEEARFLGIQPSEHPDLMAWWGPAEERPAATWRRLGQALWGEALAEALAGRSALASWPEGLAEAIQSFVGLWRGMAAWEGLHGASADWAIWAAAQELQGPQESPTPVEGRLRVGSPQAIAQMWPRPKRLLVAEASHPRLLPGAHAKAWWRQSSQGLGLPQQALELWVRLGQSAPVLEAFPGQRALDGESTTGPFAAALALTHANPPLAPSLGGSPIGEGLLQAPRRLRPRPGQAAFLAHRGGHAAVLAVPGSGKSTSLVAYAVGLLEAGVVPPWGLELITHTRVAAKHLSQSLDAALAAAGLPAGGVQVGTVHALARRLLAQVPPGALPVALGHLRVEEADDRWQGLWRRAWDEQALAQAGEAWEGAIRRCEWVLGEGELDLEEAIRQGAQAIWRAAWAEGLAGLARLEAEAPQKPLGAGLAWRFEGLRRAAGLHVPELDVGLALLLVQSQPELARAWRGPLRVLLEDEAQDTNPGQMALLAALAAEACWWVRVGDPNQSIFGFAGAQPSGLLAHAEAHPCYRLPEASRSSPAIARLANEWVDGHQAESPPPLHPAHIQPAEGAPEDVALPWRFLEGKGWRGAANLVNDLAERWPRKAAHERWAVIAPFNGVVDDFVARFAALGLPTLSGRDREGPTPAQWASFEAWWRWWRGSLPLPGGPWLGPWAQLGRHPGPEGWLEALDAWQAWWRAAGHEGLWLGGDALQSWWEEPAGLSRAMAEQAQAGPPNDPRRLVVLTVHGAKGLEFDRVWLPTWQVYRKAPVRQNPLQAWALAAWREGGPVEPSLAARQAREGDRHERIRQAYVALSRARLELTLCDLPKPEEDPIVWSWRGGAL